MNKGDRVRVYYNGHLNFTGYISTVTKYGLYIIEDGFYSTHNDCPFHPKQCRKLRKKNVNWNEI